MKRFPIQIVRGIPRTDVPLYETEANAPSERPSAWRQVAAIIGILAAIVGLITGVVQLILWVI